MADDVTCQDCGGAVQWSGRGRHTLRCRECMGYDPSIPAGLCHCGCEQQTPIAAKTCSSRGLLKGQPMRFVKGHSTRSKFYKVEVVREDPDTHCWIWQLNRQARDGYGITSVDGKNKKAHRVFFEDMVGPIPKGLTLDHLCRNTSCVNPGHLEPVPIGVNVLRGNGKAARNARKTHCDRGGHPLAGDNLYIDPKGYRHCRTCERARHQARRQKVAA